MKSVALIELNPWHGECLYSQLLFIKRGGHTVHLICHEKLRPLTETFGLADQTLYTDASAKGLLEVRRHIVRQGITTVIFNTAQGDKTLKLCLLHFPSGIGFYGILHDARKLASSLGQRLISRKVKGYFTLADFIAETMNTPEHRSKGLKFGYFYPVFSPPYERLDIHKPEGEVWILIPGSVEFGRRDYLALLRTKTPYDKRIRFVILGNSDKGDGPLLKRIVAKHGLQGSFIFFDGYVDNDTFHSYAGKSDYVIMLIHKGKGDYEGYLRHKISGSMNIALAMQKPMLCENGLEAIGDFSHHSLFYSPGKPVDLINKLPGSAPAELYGSGYDKKYSLEEQSRRYLAFIED